MSCDPTTAHTQKDSAMLTPPLSCALQVGITISNKVRDSMMRAMLQAWVDKEELD